MAKITRVTAIPFGFTGTTDDFETFGSTAVGSTEYSKDPAAIQATAAWQSGWRAALIASKAPVLQDMNGFCLVDSRQIAYLMQAGIAEWDSATVYYTGSLVTNPGTGQVFVSIIDSNTGNALPTAPASNGNWQFLFEPNSNGAGLILPGSATNDDAPASAVGEYISSVETGVNAGSSGQFSNIASISLTPGDWDVTGVASVAGGTSIQAIAIALSIYTGNTTTDQVLGDNEVELFLTASTGSPPSGLCVPAWRQSLSTTTTIYLKGLQSRSGGSPTWNGRISARRVR